MSPKFHFLPEEHSPSPFPSAFPAADPSWIDPYWIFPPHRDWSKPPESRLRGKNKAKINIWCGNSEIQEICPKRMEVELMEAQEIGIFHAHLHAQCSFFSQMQLLAVFSSGQPSPWRAWCPGWEAWGEKTPTISGLRRAGSSWKQKKLWKRCSSLSTWIIKGSCL